MKWMALTLYKEPGSFCSFLVSKPRSYAQYTPGANIHPGCKFAPGVYFGHVNGVL